MYSDLIIKGILTAYNLQKKEDIHKILKINKICFKDILLTNDVVNEIKDIKNVLKELDTLILDNVTFEKNELEIEIENLELINVKLKDINLKNVKIIKSISLDNTNIESLEEILEFKDILEIKLIEGQVVATDLDKVIIKVIPDFPNFDYLDKEQKNQILLKYDCYVKKCKEINLDKLDEFTNLNSLTLDGFVINDSIIREIVKIKNMETLQLRGEFRKNLESITSLENLKNLSFSAIQYTTISELTKFLYMTNLKYLYLEKINKVEDFLTKENKIETLIAIDCNISKIDFLLFFQGIKEIDLRNNNIKIGMQDEILDYIRKGIKFNIDNNPLIEKLKNLPLNFKNESLKKKLVQVLDIKCRKLTEFELFNKNIENDTLNINIREIIDILDNRIHLKLNLKNFKIDIDKDTDLNSYATMLYELNQNMEFVINNFASINSSVLEKLKHIKLRNKIDIKIKILNDEKEYYSLESYEYILNKFKMFVEDLKIYKNGNNIILYENEELTEKRLNTILNTRLTKTLIYNENSKISLEKVIIEEYANNKLYNIYLDMLVNYIRLAS